MIYQFIDVPTIIVTAVLTAYVTSLIYVFNESKDLK